MKTGGFVDKFDTSNDEANILPWSEYTTMKRIYYHEANILPWSEYNTMKRIYYHEVNILPWSVYTTMDRIYYHGSNILPWSEYITMKRMYYHEANVLPWSECFIITRKSWRNDSSLLVIVSWSWKSDYMNVFIIITRPEWVNIGMAVNTLEKWREE